MNRPSTVTAAAGAAILLVTGACNSEERTRAMPSSSFTAASPAENVVTVRVQGQGRYVIDSMEGIVTEKDLPSAVAARYEGGSGQRVVRVLGYPGVTGYDVVLAVNAARAAGARRVDGVADYSEDGSSGNNKVWSEPMEPLPAAAADTARH